MKKFKIGYIEKNSNFICNMHPHNYYLEILTETGLVGLFFCIWPARRSAILDPAVSLRYE